MALGKVFAGMTIATVLGVPLTAVGWDLIGWRATLLVIAALTLVIAVAVWALVPETERGKRARFADIWEVLTDRVLVPAISVTAFQMAGQLPTYAVIAVYLVEWLQMPNESLPYALITFGIGGIAGNIFAMRMVDRIGPDVLILGSLMCTGVVFIGIQVTVAIPWIVFSLLGAWAVASIVLFAPQQTRLIGMRPDMANLLWALNGSAVYGYLRWDGGWWVCLCNGWCRMACADICDVCGAGD